MVPTPFDSSAPALLAAPASARPDGWAPTGEEGFRVLGVARTKLIPQGSLGRTRHEAAQLLADAGVEGAAAEALIASGAPERHARRVRTHVEHALDAALSDEGLVGTSHEEAPPELVALAIGLLLLDAVGPAPRPGERAPRVRHRAFKHNCGPIAGDAAPVSATYAAAHGAILVLAARLGAPTPEITLEPGDGAIRVVVRGVRSETVGLLRVNSSEVYDCQPCGWMIRLAREGVDRAVGIASTPGLPPIHVGAERTAEERRMGRHPLDHLRAFAGYAPDWAALWTRAMSQHRLEAVLSRWDRVVSELPAAEAQARPPIVGDDDRRPSMARAFRWIEQLELPANDREQIANDLALGQMPPAALEERFREALRRVLGRTG